MSDLNQISHSRTRTLVEALPLEEQAAAIEQIVETAEIASIARELVDVDQTAAETMTIEERFEAERAERITLEHQLSRQGIENGQLKVDLANAEAALLDAQAAAVTPEVEVPVETPVEAPEVEAPEAEAPVAEAEAPVAEAEAPEVKTPAPKKKGK